MRYGREAEPFPHYHTNNTQQLNALEMLTHQFVEFPLWHGSESFVGWSKHSEGTRPVQVLHETCRLDCSHQRTARHVKHRWLTFTTNCIRTVKLQLQNPAGTQKVNFKQEVDQI